MEAILQFFEQMPTWHRLAWVGFCLSAGWVLEGSYPLFGLNYRKWRHARVNLAFMATSLVISLLFTAATVAIVDWVATNHFGFLNWVDLPIFFELIITLLWLDLVAQYLAHYLLHHVPWLWRFHMIHHSDTSVDATTGTRLHPGDFVVREVFALVAVALAGAPLAYYLIYRFATIFFTYLTHANVSVPRWLDGPVSLVFVTPNMHKFHHHFEAPWTDSNFGGIFSIWDRVLRTFVYDDLESIRYGLDVLDDSTDEDLGFQFRMPFNRGMVRRR